MTDQRLFSGWVYISRAPDIEGAWIAHCVDFDIMSQGDSPLHALEMVREALELAFADDLNQGLDPAERGADVAAEDWVFATPVTIVMDPNTLPI